MACTKGNFIFGNPGLAIDTNFDVQAVNAFDMMIDGVIVSVGAGADFDTGAAKVIAIDQWGSALLMVSAAGTGFLTYAAGDFASEAAAIEALDGVAVTSSTIVIGYVTIQTGSGVTWTAGTDALETGTGGTPSLVTDYEAVFGWIG